MRILLYVQGLTGSGHVVRSNQLARSLASRHDVWVTDGGQPVPGAPLPNRVRRIALSRIRRLPTGELAPLHGDATDVPAGMASRGETLEQAIEQVRPDVLLVEHFPVSKWILSDEILAVIGACRRVRQDTYVVSSLRDISPRHRFDTDEATHRQRVLDAFASHFDHLLIHADPDFVDASDYLPWLDELKIPVDYTGFVSQHPTHQDTAVEPCGDVIVSMGGAGDGSLGHVAIAAWRQLACDRRNEGLTLVVYLPLAGADGLRSRLAGEASGLSVRIEPFSADFLSHLMRANLSISHAGYNTCMNLLETRVRAILAPIARMADQTPRARTFERHGLATVLPESQLDARSLAAAMEATLQRGRTEHHFNLGGATRTRELLEAAHVCIG